MKCEVPIDWLTFSVKKDDPNEVIREYLGLNPVLFQDTGYSLLGYNKILRFSDICVCYEPRENKHFQNADYRQDPGQRCQQPYEVERYP